MMPPTIHLRLGGWPLSLDAPACGSSAPVRSDRHPRNVTCGSCRRTIAYRTRALDNGHAETPGSPQQNGRNAEAPDGR